MSKDYYLDFVGTRSGFFGEDRLATLNVRVLVTKKTKTKKIFIADLLSL